MKKLMCSVLALLTVFTCVGCRSRRDPNANTGDDYEVNLHPDTNVTATLRVAVNNYTAELKIVDELGALFKKKYPNVTVKAEPFASGISQQYSSWYNAGDMPDILINNTFDMFTLSDKGILLNLDPYIKAEAADTESDFDLNDYYESYLKMGQENFDGAQYMIARSADRVVCHYNKAIFEAAGVNMDLVKNGWTWDDFFTVCETLRTWYDANEREDYYLLDPYFTWEAVYNPIFEAEGVQYFDADGNVTLDKGDATENALKFIKSMMDKRYATPISVEQAGMEANKGCILFHSQASSNIATKLQPYYPGQAGILCADFRMKPTYTKKYRREKFRGGTFVCGANALSLYAMFNICTALYERFLCPSEGAFLRFSRRRSPLYDLLFHNVCRTFLL